MPREITKPWGSECIWAESSKYAGKLLYIQSGRKLSLQYHKQKEETIYVLKGKLELIFGTDESFLFSKILSEGESFHIKPLLIHRFCAPYDDVTLIEVSTPELDDVIRIEDDYNRS